MSPFGAVRCPVTRQQTPRPTHESTAISRCAPERKGATHSPRGMMPESGDAYVRRLAILTYLCPLMTELREVFLARRREENGAVPRQNAGQALVAYINGNLAGDLSLDALSDRFYLSKSQLGRLFKQATGSSIWEYVLIKRLLNARQRIRDGEPAGEVCQSSGFRDYSAFFRAYKKRFGLSPQEDRGRGRAG